MSNPYGSRAVVELDGTELGDDVAALIAGVIVDTDLTAPGTCTVRFSDRDGSILGQLGASIGSTLHVHTAAVTEERPVRVFVGSVYALEFDADDRGGFSSIVAYDDSYRLRQLRATKSFNEVTDGQVVRELCDDAGVDVGTIEGADVVHPYLAQTNETHWDFIARRARANDCIVYVEDGALQFRSLPDADAAPSVGDRGSSDPLQLAYGRNLIDLLVRRSAAGQVGEIEVRGWDPQQKAAVTASARPTSRSARSDADPAEIGEEHGAERLVIGWPELSTEPACGAVAASAAEAAASAMTYAEGRAGGDPRIVAGAAVSLGVTGPFDGQYTITSARHTFDSAGYFTDFRISGEYDRSSFGLLTSDVQPSLTGLRPALVTNVDDPDRRGRVKLEFPWLADEFESNWGRVMQIGAGDDRGILWFPEVGDEVIVTFLDGTPATPVVLGGLYNGVDVAPLDGLEDPADGSIDTRCLRTRTGHTVEFSDASGEERITIVTGDEAVSITLDQANGELRIECDGSVVIGAGQDLTIEAGGSLKLEATDVEVDASSGMKLSASGTMDVSGAMINLN